MRRTLGGLALPLLCLLPFLPGRCWGEGTVIITFEGWPTPAPGTGRLVTNYYELATSFDGSFARYGPPSGTNRPNNGTAYICPTAPPVSCRRDDGLSFQLVSADLAAFSTAFPNDQATFEGHRADGATVTTNVAVSGVVFRTYYFPSEFVDLTNVLVTAGALDNLRMRLPSVPPILDIGRRYSWFYVGVMGTVGLRYRLEYAERFPAANWISIADFESGYVWEFRPTNSTQRFFRAVELP